jgi:hypothetical protein
MKLLEVLPLLESRKNPEQNPKLSAYEQLLNYKDNPNVYISMTGLPKLGINPLSKYNTPLGIYCYPLQYVWDIYDIDKNKSLIKLPFVSNAKYIQVFEWNGKGKFIDVHDYTEQDLSNDMKIIFKDISPARYTEEILPMIGKAFSKAYSKQPASRLFSLINILSGEDEKTVSVPRRKLGTEMDKYQEIDYHQYSPSGRKFGNILRKLGYAGMVDYGDGIIHSNEPTQAFFLSMEYINHLDTILNKDYVRYNKNLETAKHGGLYIGEIHGKSLILAPTKYERGFNYYQDAVDYVKSLPGKWSIPSKPEFVLIGANLKKLNDDYKFFKYDYEVSYWTSSYEEYKHDDTQNIVFEYHNDNHIDFGRASTGWKPAEGAKPLDEIYYYVRPIKLV